MIWNAFVLKSQIFLKVFQHKRKRISYLQRGTTNYFLDFPWDFSLTFPKFQFDDSSVAVLVKPTIKVLKTRTSSQSEDKQTQTYFGKQRFLYHKVYFTSMKIFRETSDMVVRGWVAKHIVFRNLCYIEHLAF